MKSTAPSSSHLSSCSWPPSGHSQQRPLDLTHAAPQQPSTLLSAPDIPHLSAHRHSSFRSSSSGARSQRPAQPHSTTARQQDPSVQPVHSVRTAQPALHRAEPPAQPSHQSTRHSNDLPATRSHSSSEVRGKSMACTRAFSHTWPILSPTAAPRTPTRPPYTTVTAVPHQAHDTPFLSSKALHTIHVENQPTDPPGRARSRRRHGREGRHHRRRPRSEQPRFHPQRPVGHLRLPRLQRLRKRHADRRSRIVPRRGHDRVTSQPNVRPFRVRQPRAPVAAGLQLKIKGIAPGAPASR